ncbi:IclR family transcriptional regulator [Falsiroseomonas selenitidurans]|uniref:IclR family transcriptional regulator n=1 Tax=Falsiroseomonas selenitidurans TaxID=2716335 RepID=A0ABX1E881_9PROT|nr:IclR family transcriptional regulator [Falsiroseomonas selenitidurans]NKC33425.1 IclR family transcriptional regulator [Falsiroseomonas selenitidurans]
MPDSSPDPAGPDKSFAKGLALLRALALSPQPRGVSELAREQGLTKSNAFRLLQTLVAAGFVRRHAAGSYEAGLLLWELGAAVAGRLDLRRIAAPHLAGLAQATEESVHLSVLEGTEVLYLDKVEGPHPVRAYSRIGGRAPAHGVATGKALLAWRDPAPAPASPPPLERFTPQTITDPAALAAALAQVRAEGWAMNQGEWREGVAGLAAPIRDATGAVVAAIGISGPAERLRPRRMRAMAPLVVQAAAAISRQLGAPAGLD